MPDFSQGLYKARCSFLSVKYVFSILHKHLLVAVVLFKLHCV